jgi:hypothetical protein
MHFTKCQQSTPGLLKKQSLVDRMHFRSIRESISKASYQMSIESYTMCSIMILLNFNKLSAKVTWDYNVTT